MCEKFKNTSNPVRKLKICENKNMLALCLILSTLTNDVKKLSII